MILVTGASGQLGTDLQTLLKNQAIYTDFIDLNIVDKSAVDQFVNSHDIDLIINCAAYTAVDRAEDERDLCYSVNATGPKNLAMLQIPIIHISTDYVFSGENYVPYCELDNKAPLSVYGQSKLEGERAVSLCAKSYAIIRTSWLYSDHHPSFYQTMVRIGGERESINVVCDQIGTPTRAMDLAKIIVLLIPRVREGMKEVFHFSNEGVCSWYDFAHAIMELKCLKCTIRPILSVEYPTKAKRPCYSVMDKSKIKRLLGISIPHWRDSLRDMIINA